MDALRPPIEHHGIRASYRPRSGPPEYFVDAVESTTVWQPDVYATAAHVARAVGARRIVDVGCGNGHKLLPLAPELAVIGIDHGANLASCRERHPDADWRDHDLESVDPLPVAEDELRDAVLVSSDVIEHLVRPERLVRKLADALAVARAVVLSTPERERTWGAAHDGPPPNPAHVREWTVTELAAFLESEGLEHGELGLTRSNDATHELATILAVLVPDEERAGHVATALAGAAA